MNRQFVCVSFGNGITIKIIEAEVVDGEIQMDLIHAHVKEFFTEEVQKYGNYNILTIDQMDYTEILTCAGLELNLAGDESDAIDFLDSLSDLLVKNKFSILKKRKIAKTVYDIFVNEKEN